MSLPDPVHFSNGTNPPAVRVQHLAKSYVLQRQRRYLLHAALRKLALRSKQREVFWALEDVSFEIGRGDTVAFLGTNGAGKSTLLSIIAGTMSPSRGTVEVQGRIGALLELGAGFHPDLTGRENIELNAALLGMDGDQIERLLPSIIAFAELDEFIDVPLRSYSSGMQMRLGFSVAIHIDPEILVMDEVFAVGDQRFQRKCIERTQAMIKEGKTVLFVSHSPEAIRRLCRRVIWLRKGRVEMDGPTEAVLAAYTKAAG
jgi:lipopolysaccharide transport system ATP-binding protein